MSRRREISIGAAAIVISEGKILYTRRRRGSSWGEGSLSLPGGHIEEYEHADACVVREAKEETGLVIRPRWLDYTHVLHAAEHFRQGKHHWTVYLVADPVGGTLSNLEPHKHGPWQWAGVDELAEMCGPTDWIPLDALIANRSKIGL